MFERLFTRPTALARHRKAPLFDDRVAYLLHLDNQGHPIRHLKQVAAYLLVIVRRLELSNRPGASIGIEEINRAAKQWAKRRTKQANRKAGRQSRQAFTSHASAWLKFLSRFVPAATPENSLTESMGDFADYLHEHLGLSEVTVRGRCDAVRRCLNRLRPQVGCLQAINIAHLDDLFIGMVGTHQYSRTSVRLFATCLRSYFHFAETRGLCRAGLAKAIQTPRVYSQASVPCGPSQDEIRQLLAMTDGDRPVDVRDRAILLLFIVYGFRAGEVRCLKLDDLDWEQELITVTSSKSSHVRTYPLSHSVGNAIVRYLRNVRPKTNRRELFLTLQSPARPLTSLWHIAATRLSSIGVSLPHHGPHSLRHACATHLLSNGLSLKEIGDHLGHRDPDATRIYAKVDLANLRKVADIDLGGLV
jgi:site-specific recombinase XerD